MPSVNSMECDWCYHESKAHVPAKYVVCTGRIDTMRVKEFFICDHHAEKLVSEFQGVRGMVGGTTFDIWELHWITEKAREFYHTRTVRRIEDAAKRSTRARYLPYSLTQPDHWSVRREGWFYRDKGKIWEPVSIHGVCVGTGTAIRNGG